MCPIFACTLRCNVLVPKLFTKFMEGTDSVRLGCYFSRQMPGDKQCPISGLTNHGTCCGKVARKQGLECGNVTLQKQLCCHNATAHRLLNCCLVVFSLLTMMMLMRMTMFWTIYQQGPALASVRLWHSH